MEIEYDDLAQYERETAQFYSDPDLIGAFRTLAAQLVQGSSETALFMDAPHLA